MAMELIQKTTVVGSSTAVIEFNTIPSTYKDLRLYMGCRCANNAAREPLVITINGDSTNTNFIQYDWYQEDNGNGAEYTTSTAKTRMVAAFSADNTSLAPAPAFGGTELWINDYANTSIRQAIYGNITHYQNANPSWDNWGNGCTWLDNSAITSLAFRWFTGSNFIANSTISLYGIK
jgi:hypothetical protein